MARGIPRERFIEGVQFNGCTYALDKTFHSKHEAQAHATRRRQEGTLARVVPASPHNPFCAVYIRKKGCMRD